MRYIIYKLKFMSGVHFGEGKLSDAGTSFPADSFFSALCLEAAEAGGTSAVEAFVDRARKRRIRISDLLPYIEDEYYLPKPLCAIDTQTRDNSSEKKLFKKLGFIPCSQLEDYFAGELDLQVELDILRALGKGEIRTMSALRTREKLETGDALPFSVGVYHFNSDKDCGLYTLAGFEDAEAEDEFDGLMRSLSYSGIGGKKSSGLGRFAFEKADVPEELEERLDKKGKRQMCLNVCMAKDGELAAIIEGATYLLRKRSGFVTSVSYASRFRKKKDFYSFSAGSCFEKDFEGDIFDLSDQGGHPVYRYMIPMWMEI